MLTCLAAICLTSAVAIDGDTLRIDAPGKDLRLRLWGISAPEMRDPGGTAARSALAELVHRRQLAFAWDDEDRATGHGHGHRLGGETEACRAVRLQRHRAAAARASPVLSPVNHPQGSTFRGDTAVLIAAESASFTASFTTAVACCSTCLTMTAAGFSPAAVGVEA